MNIVEPQQQASAAPGVVTQERRGTVQVITIAAPSRRNAISYAMRLQLRQALLDAQADAQVRSVVLTGAGGAFCSGGDLKEPPSPPGQLRHRIGILQDCIRLLVAGGKPAVAAVEGCAFGAGLSLAAACDHVVAAVGARFCAAFARLGLAPDGGLGWTLPQRIGLPAARRLLMSAREVDCDWALQAGLVDDCVEDGKALEFAIQFAERYAATAPLSHAAIKQMIARGPASLDDALALETDQQSMLVLTEDHLEAKQAFLERRPARFGGR